MQLCNNNYATKVGLENERSVDTSKFSKAWFSRSNVDKLDSDKLKNVPSNLRNLKAKSKLK